MTSNLEKAAEIVYIYGETTFEKSLLAARALSAEGVLAPEPASPRPEDVPEGETWLIRPYENADPAPAFRVHASKYGPGKRWAYFRVGGSMIGFADDEDVTLIARLVPETTEQGLPFGDALIAHVNRTSVEHHQERMRVNEFDPAYTYSDRHGDVWHYEEEEWWCYQNHYRTFRANGTPPAEYGPYTRIEE